MFHEPCVEEEVWYRCLIYRVAFYSHLLSVLWWVASLFVCLSQCPLYKDDYQRGNWVALVYGYGDNYLEDNLILCPFSKITIGPVIIQPTGSWSGLQHLEWTHSGREGLKSNYNTVGSFKAPLNEGAYIDKQVIIVACWVHNCIRLFSPHSSVPVKVRS